jgi:predicted phosphodiesterase
MDIAFVGDCGVRNSVQLKTAALSEEWNPDLFLMVGDLTYSLVPSDIEKATRAFQPWIGTHKALAVPGNHDLDVANGKYHWKKYYYLPRYWAKHYPTHNLLIIGMNDGYKTNGIMIEPDGVEEDSVQASWIKAQIDKYKAGHVIVLVHHPYATGVTSGTAETRASLAWLKYLPISATIAGHTHTGEHYRYLVEPNVWGQDLINVSASAHSVRPMSSSGTTYGAYSDLVKQWHYADRGKTGPPILGRMLVYPDRIDYRVYNVNTKELMHSFTRSSLHANAT